MNSRLSYMYRDASNYKYYGEAVFAEEITDAQRGTFTAALHGGDSFLAEQVGLNPVRPGGTYPDDGIWHEALDWDLVQAPADTDETVSDFIARFTATRWDEAAAEHALVAPFLGRVNVTGTLSVGDVTLYEKCQHCDLFIEANDDRGEDIAAYLHLVNDGNPGDVATDETHEPEPSAMLATLEVWRTYGPAGMRARFTA